MRIVIPGGSGQIGLLLAREFHREGHDVVVLSRSPQSRPWHEVAWDGVARAGWASEIDGCDVVINLAGRSVNCRYSAATKRRRRAVGASASKWRAPGNARSTKQPHRGRERSHSGRR